MIGEASIHGGTSVLIDSPAGLYMNAECNHRIANSLQMVASLISMESLQLQDDQARRSLEMAGLRIQAIAGVHRRLYSTSLGEDSLDLADYLISLIRELRPLCLPSLNSGRLLADLIPMTVPPETATSLGLIAAEAVVNACKYAYSDGRCGDVIIQIRRNGLGGGAMSIADTGCGRSVDDGATKSGFGSRVIDLAADRIGATIRYEDNRPGTRLIVDFPVKPSMQCPIISLPE
ncbi:sensor histidine kinase [Rhodopseudomonas palustris]|uniref:sensor histidine kinase n=1 Tax=Rhodopseudomonas TaxID=1073 RepID=UPI0021F3A621|nr:sensor histidine kinase [Rhodopseudomonas palustris]UYO55163.1 sensor histidine kinase [Rhodopseudomonas palustris]